MGGIYLLSADQPPVPGPPAPPATSIARMMESGRRSARPSHDRSVRKDPVAQRSLSAEKYIPGLETTLTIRDTRGILAGWQGREDGGNDFGGGVQGARGRMSSDVRARTKPASAGHLDRHGSDLGKASA